MYKIIIHKKKCMHQPPSQTIKKKTKEMRSEIALSLTEIETKGKRKNLSCIVKVSCRCVMSPGFTSSVGKVTWAIVSPTKGLRVRYERRFLCESKQR